MCPGHVFIWCSCIDLMTVRLLAMCLELRIDLMVLARLLHVFVSMSVNVICFLFIN